MRAKVLLATALASVAGSLILAAPSASAESSPSAYTSRLVTLVNQARAQHGLRALAVASGTTSVAAAWSSHMAATDALSHNPNLRAQLEAHGSRNWTTYGENVGEGSAASADKLFTAYMNSPEHRANILAGAYRYLGIATVFSGGVAWNTMDFVDQYVSASTARTVTAPAPVHHSTSVRSSTRAAHPVAVRKPVVQHVSHPATATHRQVARHTVAVQHVRLSRHVEAQRAHTDVLLASDRSALPTGDAGSSARLLAALVAAAVLAFASVAWTLRRRVVA
jgi:uncharacterized protein YkwD